MSMSHYLLPDLEERFYSINFSGGRSSAYMLWHILDQYDGQLPNSCCVVFANTGKERPETLEFVHQVEERWNVPIAWLEYVYDDQAEGSRKDLKQKHRVVSYLTAARSGEPFRDLILGKNYLPFRVARICTAELKVETIARYCARDLGWPRNRTWRVVGIRGDEPRRLRDAIFGVNSNCMIYYPMALAQVTRDDVHSFWAEQEFDLGIPSALGNCDLCFMKRRKTLHHILRTEPELATWWMNMETAISHRRKLKNLKDEMNRFHQDRTYGQMLEDAMRMPDLGLDDDDDDNDTCFCTD